MDCHWLLMRQCDVDLQTMKTSCSSSVGIMKCLLVQFVFQACYAQVVGFVKYVVCIGALVLVVPGWSLCL